MARDPSRAADDAVLAMLRARADGVTAAEIGRRSGLSQQRVSQITDAVLKADLAESGEPAPQVRGAYWTLRQRQGAA